METSPGGPLAVKPTQEELQARVELLMKKRRNVKHKAHDPIRAASRFRVRPHS